MLNVSHLRKEFDTVVAVDDVSFEVRRGEMFGLLGPNGAGKTTAIRTILNIIEPDSGQITFDGKPFSQALWNTIGYLPEERGLYRKSKILNAILYFASLKGIPERQAKPVARQWLDRFGLGDFALRKVEELSKGNQQKIQLIISILHQPQLLILDEPFSGLDPVNQILLKDILLELRRSNVAIIFSTHQMEQVEKMCDNICLINKGKTVLKGGLNEIKKQYGTNSVHIEFEGDGTFLKTLPNVRRADIYQNYAELELVDMSRTRDIIMRLDSAIQLRKFEIVEPSLNSIFINVVGGPIETEGQVPALTIPGVRHAPTDPRIRKAQISVVLSALVLCLFVILQLGADKPNWAAPAAFFAIAVISLARYVQTKKKVTDELARSKSQGTP